MDEHLDIFFSNRLEVLYQQLKAALFTPSANPFMKRLIVVYGPAMKSWLTLKMAQDPDLSVAFGLEFVTLSQAFDKLLSLTSNGLSKRVPTLLELQIGIDHLLRETFTHFYRLEDAEQKEWFPLLHYLKVDQTEFFHGRPLRLSKKTERRLVALSHQLGKLFQRYGRYAGTMVNDWEQHPLTPGWQPRLWNLLFGEFSPFGWTYPAHLLTLPIHPPSSLTALHFFSISFITSCEFAFLRNLTAYFPVYYYLISPCAMFWSDIRSDREAARLQSFWQKKIGAESPQIEQLEEFLAERNPLLANFGRLGREMALQIEKSEAQTHACYVMSAETLNANPEYSEESDFQFETTHPSFSLLQAIQEDLLLMRIPIEADEPCSIDDPIGSIQLHIAPNYQREIEILSNQLIQLITADPTLSPTDILVMAPNIDAYVPYIQNIFNLKNSPLDCQILDIGPRWQTEPAQGLHLLITLAESRWEATHLIALFNHLPFLRKHQLPSEDADIIKEWIDQANIRWGDDTLHRDELMLERHCSGGMADDSAIGTWEHGLNRLLQSLTQIESNFMAEQNFVGIEFTKAELLGKWIGLLHSLRDDLRPLSDKTLMSMNDWIHYIQCLIENYFQPQHHNPESEEAYLHFSSLLDSLKASAAKAENSLFSFVSVKAYLMDMEEQGLIYRENHLQAIRFCSLIPLRSIPAKVIALIGMDEHNFPRQEEQSALNLMNKRSDTDYCPTSNDFDRYLFLEAIHSAQKHLLLSYSCTRENDSKELSPSLIVQELVAYLDQGYKISGKKFSDTFIFRHPFDSFNPCYFTQGALLHNYSNKDFLAAQASAQKQKAPPYAFITHFPAPVFPVEQTKNAQVNLKQLIAAARNPIKFYLNKVLEIYLQNAEERSIKVDEEFILSPLNQHILMKSSIQHSLKCVVDAVEPKGMLPPGLFKDVALNKLNNNIEELQSALSKHGIDKNTCCQLRFCPACTEPEKGEGALWLFPAPTITMHDGSKTTIIGLVEHAAPEGLFRHKAGTLSDIWEAWPDYLLYCSAAKLRPDLFTPSLIFTQNRTASVKPPSITDPEESLKKLIQYYQLCLNQISPLVSSWIPFILKKDAQGLQKKMRNLFDDSFGQFHDPYLKWCFNPSRLPDADSLIEDWHPYAESLCGIYHHRGSEIIEEG